MRGTARLVIADGDEAFRHLLSSAAINCGARIIGAAADGRDAARLVAVLRPDVLITDTLLPGLDGLALIEQAMAAREEGRMVCAVATANRDPAVAAAARVMGIKLFALKPCRADRLVEAAVKLYFDSKQI